MFELSLQIFSNFVLVHIVDFFILFLFSFFHCDYLLTDSHMLRSDRRSFRTQSPPREASQQVGDLIKIS